MLTTLEDKKDLEKESAKKRLINYKNQLEKVK